MNAILIRGGHLVDPSAGIDASRDLLLKDGRVAAVEATAKLGGPEARVALERAVGSSDADVRRAALTGLGSMKTVDALPVLLAALESTDASTRLIALSALEPLDAPLDRSRREAHAGGNVRDGPARVLAQQDAERGHDHRAQRG